MRKTREQKGREMAASLMGDPTIEVAGELLALCKKLLAAARCDYQPQTVLYCYGKEADRLIARAEGK